MTKCNKNNLCKLILIQFAPFSHFLVSEGKLLWDNPRKVGTYNDTCKCYRGESKGWHSFIKHYDLHRRNYLKNDDLIIFIDFEGEYKIIYL